MTALAATLQEPTVLQLAPMEAYILIGTLQLANRHTALPPAARLLAETVIDQLAAHFAPHSAIAETIRRGWRSDDT